MATLGHMWTYHGHRKPRPWWGSKMDTTQFSKQLLYRMRSRLLLGRFLIPKTTFLGLLVEQKTSANTFPVHSGTGRLN
ncbi:hypothetical protein Btru_044148 [Bulinus truncatus]|nr:hypothetical protein Btru_044148 [Bulinus truncatus]